MLVNFVDLEFQLHYHQIIYLFFYNIKDFFGFSKLPENRTSDGLCECLHDVILHRTIRDSNFEHEFRKTLS